jgi:HAMP domain-containing protein
VRLMLPLLLLMLTVGSPTNSLAQNAPQVQRHDPSAAPDDPDRQALEKEMLKKANQERQIQLRRDTDRLYQLSTELKQEVDRSSENTLSLEVIKKAEEIEKLAHSVKEKMKGN